MDEKYISTRFLNGKTHFRVSMPRPVARQLGIKDATIGTRSKLEKAIKLRDKFFKENNLMDYLITKDSEKEPELKLNELTPGIFQEVSVPYVTTIEELLKLAKIDTDVWDVDRAIVNAWGVTMKSKEGLPYKTQNHQVKAFLKKKYGEIDFDYLAEKLREVPKPLGRTYNVPQEPHALEINIPDLHYGQLCWAGESGEDYDSKIAEERFMAAIVRLLSLSSAFNIEKIYFPVGSDYFNTDTTTDTTTAGTPQHNDGRWQKMYSDGVALIIKAIETLRVVAPVEVILVQGNHDYERSYCAAHAIDMYYKDVEGIDINWKPVETKFYEYGLNMMVFAHGNGPKKKDWLKLMVANEPEMVGRTKYREVHLGHVHHETADEQGEVIVRSLGSLAATDAWHAHKGFVGAQKSASAFVYEKTKGLIANMRYNI